MKLYVAQIECLKDEKTFETYLCKVNEQRRAKVLRCKNKDDQRRSLMAGVLLRYGLEELGLSYERVEFAVTKEGKPYLKSHPEIFYSLSHSGEYVICLIADRNVGADIESNKRKLFQDGNEEKLLALAQKSFSREEYEGLVHLTKKERDELFLKLWTRKEAYGKTLGQGVWAEMEKNTSIDEKYLSFWLEKEYYVSIYCEVGSLQKEELEICMMS